MKGIKQLVPLGVILSFLVVGLAFAKANDDLAGLQLTAMVTDANASGITGTAETDRRIDGRASGLFDSLIQNSWEISKTNWG